MKYPKLCVVDTNVPKISNLAAQPESASDLPDKCIIACIEAIEHVIHNRCLVLDDGNEIFDEYRGQLSMKGQPGVGDKFMKWVHDHRWSLPDSQRVTITTDGNSYQEFPEHEDLNDFDPSDRKFVAVANAHKDKPVILQAADSKWWGWKNSLGECGITVQFLCRNYIEKKYKKKME